MVVIKDCEIDWNGQKAIVKLKRLTFGEVNQVNEESMDIKIVNGQPLVKISQAKLMELSLLKSIVEAPFTIDLTNIKNLDPNIGNELFQEHIALNSPDNKKKD